MRCFLCNQQQFQLLYKTGNFAISQCQNDGLVMKEKKEKRKQKKLYTKAYFSQYPYATIFNLHQRYFAKKVETIKKLIGDEKPHLLDVGCGWGDFLQVVKEKNLPYLGIDIAEEAVNLCREKGLKAEKTDIKNLRGKKKFVAITAFQLIEHLKNPLPFLKKTYQLLEPGGLILLTTPDNNSFYRKVSGGNWSVYHTDSHWVFYTKDTLKKTLTRAGFVKIKVRRDNIRFFTLNYILDRMKKAISLPRPILSLPIPTDPTGDILALGFKI